MKNKAMQNGTKMMVMGHSKFQVEFKDGIPYATLYDCWADAHETAKLNIDCLEEAEDYPYYIEIVTFSFNAMAEIVFKRYHKTEFEANEDKEKFVVGEDYLDDIEIKAVKGPFKD